LGGFAYLFSREPFPDPDRLTTSWRVWVPASDALSRRTLEQAGVSPVPLALAEVYTSLQTGVINTFATTPSGAIILQWHSRARHMLDLPVLMTLGTIGLDQRAFGRLDEESQQIVLAEFASALKGLENSNREENERARAAIAGQGITIYQPTAAQQTAWQSIAEETRHAMVQSGQIRIPHLERLERELESVSESP
ncbi:MAG: TRAP transporter substrate-binding protein DctP, partial [Wenzhouxiangella sp.]